MCCVCVRTQGLGVAWGRGARPPGTHAILPPLPASARSWGRAPPSPTSSRGGRWARWPRAWRRPTPPPPSTAWWRWRCWRLMCGTPERCSSRWAGVCVGVCGAYVWLRPRAVACPGPPSPPPHPQLRPLPPTHNPQPGRRAAAARGGALPGCQRHGAPKRRRGAPRGLPLLPPLQAAARAAAPAGPGDPQGEPRISACARLGVVVGCVCARLTAATPPRPAPLAHPLPPTPLTPPCPTPP